MSITLSSPAFDPNKPIPDHFTCDGESASPPLEWSGVPENTASIALIVEDADARDSAFTHWVIFNIPPETNHLNEDMGHAKRLPDGSYQGRNSAGKVGYIGPCPYGGTHRYLFKLYALDTRLDLDPGITRDKLEEAMQGHVIDEGQLMGTNVRIPHYRH